MSDGPRRNHPRDRVTDAERFGIDQYESDPSDLCSAIDPGMVGPALNHDISRFERDCRGIHFHIDLARNDDDVINRFRPMHRARSAGRNVIHRKPRTVRRRSCSEYSCTHVLEILTDRHICRRFASGPDECCYRSRARIFLVCRRPIDDYFRHVVQIVPRYDSSNRGVVRFLVCHSHLQIPASTSKCFGPTSLDFSRALCRPP